MLIMFFSNACADHDVHQRLEQLAEDFVREDGRRLAHLQPPASLHRGPRPHLYGHPQVNIFLFFLEPHACYFNLPSLFTFSTKVKGHQANKRLS